VDSGAGRKLPPASRYCSATPHAAGDGDPERPSERGDRDGLGTGSVTAHLAGSRSGLASCLAGPDRGAAQARSGGGDRYTSGPMSKRIVEKHLSASAERLRRLRGELAVVDEQLAFLAEAADDTRLRALVAETPLADREHSEARRHADAMAAQRARLVASIARLESSQDQLLDRLLAER
jgi:hypothetical protein